MHMIDNGGGDYAPVYAYDNAEEWLDDGNGETGEPVECTCWGIEFLYVGGAIPSIKAVSFPGNVKNLAMYALASHGGADNPDAIWEVLSSGQCDDGENFYMEGALSIMEIATIRDEALAVANKLELWMP